jgi:hypothetical protein
MLLHEPKGTRSMQSHPQAQIDSRPEPSPMSIIGAILAQGAIRFLDRQKRESKGPLRKASTPLSRCKTE